jgi:DNA-binding transcriptional LysR family regulator
MEIRHLRYFVAVAEELHFTRAAAKLQTAQPALSQQIRRLERELGTPLFHRSNRSVEMTHAGRVFLHHARRVIEAADRAKRAAKQASEGDLGTLTIGFLAQPTVELLPDLLASYRDRHPHVEIELHEMQNQEQVDALMRGRLDIALMTHRARDSRVCAVALQRFRLVVAMPVNHGLAERSFVRLRDLSDEPWIYPVGSSGPLYAACAKAGFEPRIAQQATEHAVRLALVAAGLGLTLDLEAAGRTPNSRVVYRQLTPEVCVDLVASWRRDRLSPVVEGFLGVARAAAKSRSVR